MIDTAAIKNALQVSRPAIEDRIQPSVNCADLGDLYGHLKDYVDMVKSGYSKTLFVLGNCGLGKTQQISNWLSNTEAVRVSGHVSPKKLYRELYANREGKILFFDDTESMLNNQITIVLLKQALDTCDRRIVSWDSSSLTDIPNAFDFKSRVIFCLNAIPSDLGFQAIMSRADRVAVWFDYAQIVKLMERIATVPRKVNGMLITPESRTKIVNWIKLNSDPSIEDFNLRTQNKIENYFAYDGQRWQTFALEMLSKKNEKTALLLEILKRSDETKEQVKEWKALTGQSERAFYRAKAKLGRCQTDSPKGDLK